MESVDTPASDISSVSSDSSDSTDNYDKSSNFSSGNESGSDNESDIESESDNDSDNPKCRTCGGKCRVQIRTILQDSEGKFVPVHFCSIVCFEDERFPEKCKKSDQFAARNERKAKQSSSSQNNQ